MHHTAVYHVNIISEERIGCLSSNLTRHIGLTYDGKHVTPLCQSDPAMNMDQLQKEFGLHAWSDASWGTEKNHGGHIIMMCNAAIAWCSRRIKVITLSSTEAEMCAGVGATKDILFVRQILKFLKVGICGPTPLAAGSYSTVATVP